MYEKYQRMYKQQTLSKLFLSPAEKQQRIIFLQTKGFFLFYYFLFKELILFCSFFMFLIFYQLFLIYSVSVIISKIKQYRQQMFKDPKLNKSPIESILHESFEQIIRTNTQNMPQQPMFVEHRGMTGSEHPQFKISGHNSHSNINCQSMQQKLKVIQVLSSIQVQSACQTISTIIKNKALNKEHEALQRIKKCEQNKNQSTNILKSDKNIVIKKMQLIFQKMDSVFRAKRIKFLGTTFIEIQMVRFRSMGSDKSSSIVSPYRGYIKNDSSQRGDSEWELAHSQGNIVAQENLVRENKFLRKKKQKIKNNREEFYTKIDEMLSFHENFISKK